MAHLPDEALGGVCKALVNVALPLLPVCKGPVRLRADKLVAPGPGLRLLGMSAVCFAGSELGWRFSMRRYTSASS